MKIRVIRVLLLLALGAGAVVAETTQRAIAEEPAQRPDFRNFMPELDSPAPNLSVGDRGRTQIMGVIYPKHQLTLSLAVSGVVHAVPVAEGDEVAQGALLVALEQELEALELQRLEMLWQSEGVLRASQQRLALITEQLNLAQMLYDQSRSVSRDELNALRMQKLSLEAETVNLELEKQRQALDFQIGQGRLEQRNLRAPLAGLVTRVTVNPGEWVQAGEPIIELVDSSESFIRFSLPSRQAREFKRGDEIAFEVEGVAGVGIVSFVAPVADPASGRFEIKITFDNPNQHFRPGLTARISL